VVDEPCGVVVLGTGTVVGGMTGFVVVVEDGVVTMGPVVVVDPG
jgi:hypothetical protein